MLTDGKSLVFVGERLGCSSCLDYGLSHITTQKKLGLDRSSLNSLNFYVKYFWSDLIDLYRHFAKEYSSMSRKDMKRYSTSLVIWEMHIKAQLNTTFCLWGWLKLRRPP